MYCKHCGKEVNDNAVVCIHCGCALDSYVPPKTSENDESKTGMGILMALLLGVIGLVVGICLYPENSFARKTFIKGWGITLAISIGAGILLGVLYAIMWLPLLAM